MFRLRPARLALLVPLALSCGCACSGDRPRLIDRFRVRSDGAECCPRVEALSPVPMVRAVGPAPCQGCAVPASPPMMMAPCEGCGDGLVRGQGPFLGMPPGEMYPSEPLPPPGTYEPPLYQVPEPLPPAGVQEGLPGEAQPLPAGAMSRPNMGKVANGWR